MEGSEEEAAAGLQEEGGTRSLEPELQGHRRGSWEKEDQGVPSGEPGSSGHSRAGQQGLGTDDAWLAFLTCLASDTQQLGWGAGGVRETLQAPKHSDTGPCLVSLWFLSEWNKRPRPVAISEGPPHLWSCQMAQWAGLGTEEASLSREGCPQLAPLSSG